MNDNRLIDDQIPADEGSSALDPPTADNLHELISHNSDLHELLIENSRREQENEEEMQMENPPRSDETEQNYGEQPHAQPIKQKGTEQVEGESSSDPLPRSLLSDGIRSQQHELKSESANDNPGGFKPMPIPEYEDDNYPSANPSDLRDTDLATGDSYETGNHVPDIDRNDIPEILEREPQETFTPTSRKRKVQYQKERRRGSGSGQSRDNEQRLEDHNYGLEPESSAQAAQRVFASTPIAPNVTRSGNVDGEGSSSVTASREGTSEGEKPFNVQEPSPQFTPDQSEYRDRHQISSGVPTTSSPSTLPNSNTPVSTPVVRPLVTPRQQRVRTLSTITERERRNQIMLPQWQPDSEVDECPICGKYFNFFLRKHHCRKCGRVVCSSCSPHRITIPYQYIVQPPAGFDDCVPEHIRTRSRTISQNSVHDSDVIGGGMKVRLCNPCVPDPNISPPAQTLPLDRPLPPLPMSSTPPQPPPRSSSRIQTSELCPVCGDRLPPITTAIENHIDRCITRRLESVDINASVPQPQPSQRRSSEQALSSSSLPSSSNATSHPTSQSTRPRHTSEATALGIPESAQQPPSRPFLSSRMICFAATQIDTVGEDKECIICMEDFEEGVEMARLECLCKYHKRCIDGWFFQHPGRCPVHGQDNY